MQHIVLFNISLLIKNYNETILLLNSKMQQIDTFLNLIQKNQKSIISKVIILKNQT